MTKIVNQIPQVKTENLQLEAKSVPSEAINHKNDLNRYGIKNKTSEFITKKQNEQLNLTNEVLKNKALRTLVSIFGIFKVVSYKDLDAVAKEHNLFISRIKNYEEVIPEGNLNELKSFEDFLKDHKSAIGSGIKFNGFDNSFVFEENNYKSELWNLDTKSFFFVAAPKSHFKNQKYMKVGNEIVSGIETPKFKLDLKLAEPQDPIIFMPVALFDKVYCIIVTAWDEVADDLRIRSLF